MLVNKKQIKQYCHEQGKNISEEALEVINRKLQVLLNRAVRATSHFKTIKAKDVCLFHVKLGEG